MPIQFRCPHCKQMLSISSKRAGSTIVCPACTEEALVPIPGEPTAAYDVVAHLGTKSTTAAAPPPPAPSPVVEAAAKSASAPSRPAGSAYSTGAASSHQPLFEEVSPHTSSHDDEDEHEDDEEHHTPKPKKRFMDDTVDMTAMVDVTFLLLIFFMVTASFAAQKVFETSPPEQEAEGGGASASSMEDLESNSVVLEIDAHDQMEIEGQPIAGLFELRETLQAKSTTESKNELLIQAHYNATHGMVVSVTDVAMDAGMQKVRRISKKSDD